MAYYLFRRGNGNEGNFPRAMLNISEGECPFSALHALCANERISGSRTRRHIMKEMQVDGEPEYGILGHVYEGPDGETDFGAAWLTAELEPYTPEEYACSSYLHAQSLREALDSAAFRFYRRLVKGKQ